MRFRDLSLLALLFPSAGCALQPHCIMNVKDAVPAYRLPCEYRNCGREGTVPLDLSLLSQQRPDDHEIAAGDLLGLYVAGVVPAKVEDQPVILPPQAGSGGEYYPPYGKLRAPNVGMPIEISSHGAMRLPLVGKVDVANLTIDEATDKVRAAYEAKGIVQKDRERVMLTLIRPRVTRVVVMREDAQAPPQFLRKDSVPYTKVGHGEVIDLPAYENDVLHALAESGGLPGIDAYSEVWVFRNRLGQPMEAQALQQQLATPDAAREFAERWEHAERQLVRIPLRVYPGAPLPFSEEDILLEDGDVVYLPPREEEYFYTGGQLLGGKIPLPRDKDIDVLEAIALANGAVGGPSVSNSIFRTGPGNVIPPTQALVVRKLPNGQLLRIRVDLNRALHDPNERMLLHPEDQLFVFYKPSELYTNILLNFIGVNVNLIPKI